jgi:endo-1,4-beta-xylanase
MVGSLALLVVGSSVWHQPTLCEAARHRFLIGTAIKTSQLVDPARSQLILQQINCLTAEYEFMPSMLQPSPGSFNFVSADRIADFARTHHLPLTGHMLCWHLVTPSWMFEEASGGPEPDRGV